MAVFTGIMGLQWWQIKRYITKVDNLENRVTKIETMMELLGDIKADVGGIKTDVEVIKSRMS